MQPAHLTPASSGPWVRWLVTLVYALCLLMGAVVGLVVEIYVQSWFGVGEALFLLLCATAFIWGARLLHGPSAASGQRARIPVNPNRLFLRLGLVLTGVGTVNALVMAQVLRVYDLYDQWIAFYPQAMLVLGGMLATFGVSIFLVDAALRIANPSTMTNRSPRQWGLIFTGIGTGTAVAMFLLSRFAIYVQDTGPPYVPLMFLGLGYLLAAGGLITLIVDGAQRRTGRLY
jgi:hypothetical protein